MQTISPEIFGESLHVAGETPESVDLRVKNLQEPAAQVIHSLGITDLWIKWCTNKEFVSLTTKDAMLSDLISVNKPEVSFLLFTWMKSSERDEDVSQHQQIA